MLVSTSGSRTLPSRRKQFDGPSPYASPLHQFVEEWLEARDTNWEWLCNKAGVATSTGTEIKNGSTPRRTTLEKLAAAMEVSMRTMSIVAGYVKADELEPEDIDLNDPELRLFFKGDWKDMTEDEREFIKDSIRSSRKLLAERRKRA